MAKTKENERPQVWMRVPAKQMWKVVERNEVQEDASRAAVGCSQSESEDSRDGDHRRLGNSLARMPEAIAA